MASDDGPTTQPGEPQLSDSLRTFGAVLRALRDEAGLTREEFGPLVGYSAPYIAKIEQGKRYPPSDLPVRAEEALGQLAVKVLEAAGRSLRRRPGLASWFQHWASLEEDAVSLYAYECRVLPGLLQPEPYARRIFERRLPPLSDTQVERQITARLKRQKLMEERQNTLFSFVIEQAVLERHMGGPQITADAIDHLLSLGTRANVEIQLMPLQQEDHAGYDGQMYIAETPTHDWIGYTEGHRSSNLITAPQEVSALLQRYGKLRAQAMDHRATVSLLEEMRGAL
ncbi:helix-turn-helix domain-containing protein [Streptomyces xiaopingdaonensis]|uniref:helix-turn-helix domain-containing protein n=1 Tax=Streptomyces xiaopingdaonensis TaxID=1565415 RepID=UPI0003829FBA|nr:helix-turn-helix transcriptional regulator [Streptomyces xiaopingdaonensis]